MAGTDLEVNESNTGKSERRLNLRRFLKWLPVILFAAVLVLVGIKSRRIYQKGMSLYQDLTVLRESARGSISTMDIDTLKTPLVDLDKSLSEFESEALPLLGLAPSLGWVPTYGGDIANAPALIELADRLVDASIASLEAAKPLLEEVNSPQSSLDPPALTALLVDAQPELLEAQEEFDQALEARERIEAGILSPRLQGLLSELDPLLGLMDDGLSLSTTLPSVLGADGNGPKTYLLLVQNEDELRPTGGFITSVGRLVIDNGEIVSLVFESVDSREDWTRPYPSAPWQLQEYMNADVLILRDSNWFTDFPTSALWAKYLYGYDHPGPVDGVIAFDQQFLVMLLGILGPLEVEGAPQPITSDNVIEYMRTAKAPPEDEPVPADWYRKGFIEEIADALLHELIDGKTRDWRGLVLILNRALKERHLLLQFDDPQVTSLLVRNDWDNAVRPLEGDFLMTTDTNIGFNKTSALMEVSLSYSVDLSDLSAPRGALVMTHENNSNSDVPCIQWGYKEVEGVEWYPMDRCYWTYLRVYKQAGVELVDASPHEIPAEQMLLERRVPAHIDDLEEDIHGVRGFGTLLVVPGGQSFNTGFEFALPASVISQLNGSNLYVYRLKVQKQPGTLANPLAIRVHLPNRSRVESVNMDAFNQGDSLLIETDLRTDVYLEVVFHVP